MDEAGWLIIAAGAAGVLAGWAVTAAFFLPLRKQVTAWRDQAVRLDEMHVQALDHLAAKRAESARYADAIARITTSLAEAKPDAGPFYPHRLAAYREAVGAVLNAVKDTAA